MSERGPGTRDLPLFQSHSPTSKAAWEKATHKLTKRGVVYDYIRERGEWGATDPEGQASLKMDGNTYRPRRVENVEMGRVRDSGRTRKTLSGRSAVVWVAV